MTANEGVSLSDSGCRRLSIRLQMQETLYQTADAGVTENAGVSLSDSGCRRLSQTADAGDTLSDS